MASTKNLPLYHADLTISRHKMQAWIYHQQEQLNQQNIFLVISGQWTLFKNMHTQIMDIVHQHAITQETIGTINYAKHDFASVVQP